MKICAVSDPTANTAVKKKRAFAADAKRGGCSHGREVRADVHRVSDEQQRNEEDDNRLRKDAREIVRQPVTGSRARSWR